MLHKQSVHCTTNRLRHVILTRQRADTHHINDNTQHSNSHSAPRTTHTHTLPCLPSVCLCLCLQPPSSAARSRPEDASQQTRDCDCLCMRRPSFPPARTIEHSSGLSPHSCHALVASSLQAPVPVSRARTEFQQTWGPPLPSTPTVTGEHMSGLSPHWCHALDAPSIRGRHLCYQVSVSVSVSVSVWGQGQGQGWSWRQVCSNPCLTSSGTSQCVDSCKTQQGCDLDAHSSTPSTTTPCQLTSWCSRAIRQSDNMKAGNTVVLDLETAAHADPIAAT